MIIYSPWQLYYHLLYISKHDYWIELSSESACNVPGKICHRSVVFPLAFIQYHHSSFMNRQLASRILLQSSWQGALRRSFALSSSCRRFCTNVENHQRHSSTHHPNNKSHPISSSSPITSAATRYRPVSFYRLTPLSKERVEQLRKQIFDQLTTWGVVGRIYLAPEQGISGINCQIAAPIHMLPMVRQFFDGLDMGQIEYTEGLEDLDTPCFRKLRVMIKKNVSEERRCCHCSSLGLHGVLACSNQGCIASQ